METENRPEQIGRYIIEDELGRGGMATVYKACDPNFERDVAIKVLPQSLLHDPKFRIRFEREGKMIARLEHHAIVPVYDFGEHEGQPFIVMRLMTGGDLSGRLRDASITRDDVSQIVARLAGGLDVAHSNGVIHRDLKPGNVLFDNYGDAYLSDFGIARLMEGDATLTGSGIIGTPAYMSPEQIQGEKDIDGRSDIYSLGVILYLMLSGEMPYEADTPGKVMIKHVLDPVPDISVNHPDIPASVSAVIAKALAKNPDERYQTGNEMAIAYESAVSATAKQITPVPKAASQTRVSSRGRLETVANRPSSPEAKTRSSLKGPNAAIPTAPQISEKDSNLPDSTFSEPRLDKVASQPTTSPDAEEISDRPDSSPAVSWVESVASKVATPSKSEVEPIDAAPTPAPSSEVEEAANAQVDASAPKDKAGARKWAVPALTILILAIALVGFLAFYGSRSRAAVPIAGGAVDTPTQSAPEETEELVGITETIVAQNASPIPAETSLPTVTSQAALPTTSESTVANENATSTLTEPEASPEVTEELTPEAATQATPEISASQLQALMDSANILVFEDVVGAGYEIPYVKETLDEIGLNYKWDGNARGRMLADLASGPEGGGPWDLAIIALENRDISSGDLFEFLGPVLEQGTSVILEIWHLDHTTQETMKELIAACGVQVEEYFPRNGSSLDAIVYPIIGASHPILSEPNSGLQFTDATDKYVASRDLGDLMSLTGTGDAQLLIGVDAGQKSEGGVLATCLEERLTLMTFSSHTFSYETMKPLWENMIYNALKVRYRTLQ